MAVKAGTAVSSSAVKTGFKTAFMEKSPSPQRKICNARNMNRNPIDPALFVAD
jgi:hypothetical protein